MLSSHYMHMLIDEKKKKVFSWVATVTKKKKKDFSRVATVVLMTAAVTAAVLFIVGSVLSTQNG